MLVISSLVIGAAVAQDAFAVSAMYGTRDRTKRFFPAFAAAFTFALFQLFMPVLGWSVGQAGSRAVGSLGNIIAFFILSFIGIKMMIDSKKGIEDNSIAFTIRSLILMAFATSIDAMTIGITLPVTAGADSFPKLMLCACIIGAVTFIICFTGYIIGRRISTLKPSLAQVIGGAVLVAIGIKTLLVS